VLKRVLRSPKRLGSRVDAHIVCRDEASTTTTATGTPLNPKTGFSKRISSNQAPLSQHHPLPIIFKKKSSSAIPFSRFHAPLLKVLNFFYASIPGPTLPRPLVRTIKTLRALYPLLFLTMPFGSAAKVDIQFPLLLESRLAVAFHKCR
jgi:hypothetical protein